MRREAADRRGSALLIVLGMISFMIVSAVAFSVYMRMSRAPSSYLRRTVATQNLVKAALARAIEDIDGHIGNDPYPGVGPNATDGNRHWTSFDGWQYRGCEDRWINRVFCPYADLGGPDTSVTRRAVNNGGSSSYVEFDDTVSVLTLEGLGYIPAPLVNQARYWSRRSSTARWKRFNYDLGRWAYAAINVSDLLDVNTIRAYTNRNSGAFGRLSLGTLVKEAGGDPKSFDDMVANPGGDNVPLVSIMDFNLAAKAKMGEMPSPFCDWITGGKASGGFYGGAASNKIASLLFTTDSWYPSTNQFSRTVDPDACYYLSNPEHQPFLPGSFTLRDGLLDLIREKGVGKSYVPIFDRYLKAVGSACLYDYLDRDSVPLSLALPCTEQVPMISCISLIDPGLRITVTMKQPPAPPAPEPGVAAQPVPQDYEYKFKFDDLSIRVVASLLYPFKRIAGATGAHVKSKPVFRVQAIMKMCLGAEDMRMRASTGSPLHPIKDEWNLTQPKYENGVFTFVSQPRNVNIPDASTLKLGEDEDAIIDAPISFTARFSDVPGASDDGLPLFTYSHKVTPGSVSPPTDAQLQFFWNPYDANGEQAAWTPGTGFDKTFKSDKVRPNFFLWIRVIDEDNKTVDLAPAMLQDDQLNDTANWGNMFYNQLDTICGRGVPLFNFTTQAGGFELPVKQADLIGAGAPVPAIGGTVPNALDVNVQTASPISTDYTSLFCYDPRYNFAPEDWYSEGGGADANAWIKNLQDNLLGRDGRDSDVFMFVSNQEYLQSMGELAFLPRVQYEFDSPGDDSLQGNFFDRARYDGGDANSANGATFAQRKGFHPERAANNNFFWRTYRTYRSEDRSADPIYNLVGNDGKRIYDDDGRGPRVNPYSDDPNILLAAVGNTPYDYWAASTNVTLGAEYANDFAKNVDEAQKYCFNKDSPLAEVSDEGIKAIAAVISLAMRLNPGNSWQTAYDSLDWSGDGDPEKFLGVEMKESGINEVDRKFLYSFWRGCFGNRQQLFIVFVRAEPSVLGGAQQGGRAVALVWRDPAPPIGYADRKGRQYEKSNAINHGNEIPPHRTRILFYHQFD